MLPKIRYVDRATKQICTEEVYGEKFVLLLQMRWIGPLLSWLVGRFSLVSRLYGALQRRPSSAKKVKPFVERYGLDPSEFAQPLDTFASFDDFFTRKLRPSARPISDSPLICPADGRYWVCPSISRSEGFLVKGRWFDLDSLLQSKEMAEQYSGGAMVMARLCPTDYHRFHFPCSGHVGQSRQLPGSLRSVNPWATHNRMSIFSENKRAITLLENESFGQVLIVEVGATCVGTIHQTFLPDQEVEKGDEKGYFSFGGSSMILLFEPKKLKLSSDLVDQSACYLETLCQMGQSLL